MSDPSIFVNPNIKSFIPKAPICNFKWNSCIAEVLAYMILPAFCKAICMDVHLRDELSRRVKPAFSHDKVQMRLELHVLSKCVEYDYNAYLDVLAHSFWKVIIKGVYCAVLVYFKQWPIVSEVRP